MAEPSKPTTPRHMPAEELPWGILYLREDIQDLRNGLQQVHGRTDEINQSLGSRIDDINQSLGARLDELNRSLTGRIDEQGRFLLGRIDEKHDSLAKRFDARFTWLMTTMVGLSGIIIAVIKL